MVLDVPAQMVFDWHDRDGIPFERSFEIMAENKAICNLRKLLSIAVNRGWRKEEAKRRIDEAWRKAYPTNKEAFRAWCGR